MREVRALYAYKLKLSEIKTHYGGNIKYYH